MSLFTNMRITQKLTLVYACLILAVLAMSSVVYKQANFISETSGWTKHTHVVLGESRNLSEGMINQETGLRGYLLSADRKFLEPYETGAKAVASAASEIARLTSDNAQQQDRLKELGRLIGRWQGEYLLSLWKI